MNEPKVIKLNDWPRPNTSPEAAVVATESSLLLRYYTGEDEVALVEFPLVRSFKFGSPNDESLTGHPLKAFGLEYYCAHEVKNSPWVRELEKQNSVHPKHEKEKYISSSKHYIITFQDSTLECVAITGEFWHPKIKALPASEAIEEWNNFVNKISWDT